MIALALVIITSSSLAEAAPNLNNVEQTEPTVVIEQVQTDPAPVEPTKVEPVVEPKPVVTPAVKVPQPKPKPVITGDKTTWMSQAGIPESEWEFVDYIVSRESSWNPLAVNKSSGACSLAQSLPCSKIPGDWRDPVNALKWQYQYVINRYGGYRQAYQFWTVNHWY